MQSIRFRFLNIEIVINVKNAYKKREDYKHNVTKAIYSFSFNNCYACVWITGNFKRGSQKIKIKNQTAAKLNNNNTTISYNKSERLIRKSMHALLILIIQGLECNKIWGANSVFYAMQSHFINVCVCGVQTIFHISLPPYFLQQRHNTLYPVQWLWN